MEITHSQIPPHPGKIITQRITREFNFLKKNITAFLYRIKTIGYSSQIDEYELRKLGIFNLLNFFQFISGLIIPFTGVLLNKKFPSGSWIVACLPALVSITVLYLNKRFKHEAAFIVYFLLYPFFTSVVFIYGMNLGIDLNFILFGILAVFFLKDLGFMIFSISFSMASFFALSVVLKQFIYQLEDSNKFLYLFNEWLSILFIFYGLYLIKKENSVYQVKILHKNDDLREKNIQIQIQSNELKSNATLLEKQTIELTELNNLKNKLFGIISHDLKAPMYALRNLFNDIQENKLSAANIKKVMPEVSKDLNYTVGLMDNLLQWAKTQMQSEVVYPQQVDIGKLLSETVQLVRLQSESKKIIINLQANKDIYGIMDKEMIKLVLRNLLSNAIKFTPENGTISIGVNENINVIEVFVQDSGGGISNEALWKINNNDFYTTRGTANESGTGLGLMLCKEYLSRNGSQLFIESNPGIGSIFSFTLPKSTS